MMKAHALDLSHRISLYGHGLDDLARSGVVQSGPILTGKAPFHVISAKIPIFFCSAAFFKSCKVLGFFGNQEVRKIFSEKYLYFFVARHFLRIGKFWGFPANTG